MSESERPANHLAGETSPYLLQHVHNPVDWHPWGREALEKARAEDKPIFLSIGYSACHWCHVMAHESFESETVAARLNESFVNIKVDREERPDVDEVYMTATQIMTHSGGWPMSVFLTPDLKPFFCGTYFPPDDRYGRPGFIQIVESLAQAWHERREEVTQQADRIAEAVGGLLNGGEPAAPITLDRALLDGALRAAREQFDSTHGGFGSAPKFPPSMRLEMLLRLHEESGDDAILRMVTHTLDRMARGGMYDQVGGGFHRYSVDEIWLAPHFEKMLYDNAQLARVYLLAWERTGNWYYRRVAEETLDYVLREMTDERGGFYSATDADSEGEEGLFFLWRPKQVVEVLGEEDGGLFCRVYDIHAGGNFEGQSIPNLIAKGLDEWAAEMNETPEGLDARLATMRRRLWEAREGRVHPGLDDKTLTAWNGLMIRAFATGARVLGEDRYLQAAERAAGFILAEMRDDGRLLRTYRRGEAKLNAYLDDYAFLAAGLLDLHEATDDSRWLEEARSLMETLDEHHWDEALDGYFYTSHDHEELIARAKSLQDGALPNGNAVAAETHVRLARLGVEADLHRGRAEAILRLAGNGMQEYPSALPQSLIALDHFLALEPVVEEPAPMDDAAPVQATAKLATVAVRPGDTFRVAIRLSIAAGFHVNSHEPTEAYLIPTTMETARTSELELLRRGFPEAELIEAGGAKLSVYAGEVTLGLELRAPESLGSNEYALEITVGYQACEETLCRPPARETVTVMVPVEPSRAEPPQRFEAELDELDWQ